MLIILMAQSSDFWSKVVLMKKKTVKKSVVKTASTILEVLCQKRVLEGLHTEKLWCSRISYEKKHTFKTFLSTSQTPEERFRRTSCLKKTRRKNGQSWGTKNEGIRDMRQNQKQNRSGFSGAHDV